MAVVEFSAQFGDQESADLVLPHFRGLKAAARGREFEGFPARSLAFILRVDGANTVFGVSGPHNVAFDAKRAYISVDIGVTFEDRTHLRDRLVTGILASVDMLRAMADRRLAGANFESMEKVLRELCADYETQAIPVGRS